MPDAHAWAAERGRPSAHGRVDAMGGRAGNACGIARRGGIGYAKAMRARVASCWRRITVRSVNGPAVTSIVGSPYDSTQAMRCVFLQESDRCVLSGFTLAGGYAADGGAVYSSIANNLTNRIENCVIAGNSAGRGGGVFGGYLVDCVVSGNVAATAGGATVQCKLLRCLVVNNVTSNDGGTVEGFGGGTWGNGPIEDSRVAYNRARDGGAVKYVTSYNCQFDHNEAERGGGTYNGAFTNCILLHNRALTEGMNYYPTNMSAFTRCCLSPDPGANGCFDADPLFAAAAWEDYHLTAASPCVDAGTNVAVLAGSVDLDGDARRQGPFMDIGCDEAGVVVTNMTPGMPPTYHLRAATGSRVQLLRSDDWTGGLWTACSPVVTAEVMRASLTDLSPPGATSVVYRPVWLRD